jgi:vacuolar-type H+-ATPase subunit H
LQTADAQKILNENFDQFVAASTDGYGRISDELKGIIDLDRQFGTNSEAVARFMQQQASDVAAGLSDLLEQPMLTADAAVGQALDDAQKKLDDLKASGTASAKQLQDAQDAVTKALTDQHAAAERDRQAINDLGEEALLSFNASIAAGDSFTTALQKIAPQLTTVQQAFKDLGIDVDNAAVKGLLLQNTILNGPDGKGGVGRAITGLQTMFTAATNMPGVMTPEAFAAQQRTLGSIYTQTQGAAAAAGGTTIDALAPFQQTLHEMADWAAKNHVELDDNTKQMIDQSRELGIWNADFKTDSEKTRDSIANLITSNDALAAALGGLPDALAAVMAGRTPPPPPTTPTYAALGGVVTRFGLARPRYFDSGGFVAPWAAGGPLWTDPGVVSSSKLVAMIPKGSDIVPAMLRVGETVLTPDEGDLMSRLMAQARLGTIGGEMGGWDAKTTALIAARAAAQAAGTGGPDTVNKVYNVTITAKNDEAAEKWRDWMRADGVAIAVEEFEDGRFVSRMNRALDR